MLLRASPSLNSFAGRYKKKMKQEDELEKLFQPTKSWRINEWREKTLIETSSISMIESLALANVYVTFAI